MTDITTHQASRRRLLLALAITCSFMLIQLVGAYYSNSLAVLADAGHLFVHNSSLFIAVIASSLAIHLASSYNKGYQKVELAGGLINGILYLVISSVILFKGSQSYTEHHGGAPHSVDTFIMSSIAAIGVLFHGAAAFVLYKGRKDSINVYAVFLHTFFDLLSTVSTFITSFIIAYTGWEVADILVSMLIAIFVLFTGIKVVVSCVRSLFFAVPSLPEAGKVEALLMGLEHVENVHNLTLSLRDNQAVVGAHIVLKHHCTIEKHDTLCRKEVEQALKNKFGIEQTVLQIEASACGEGH